MKAWIIVAFVAAAAGLIYVLSSKTGTINPVNPVAPAASINQTPVGPVTGSVYGTTPYGRPISNISYGRPGFVGPKLPPGYNPDNFVYGNQPMTSQSPAAISPTTGLPIASNDPTDVLSLLSGSPTYDTTVIDAPAYGIDPLTGQYDNGIFLA